MAEIYLKKISTFPVRYGIFNEEEMMFSIGTATYKHFFKTLHFSENEGGISDPIASHPELLDSLKKMEENFLREEMFSYLARQETSPAKLEQWLSARTAAGETRREWILHAQEQNFISVERYLLWAVEKMKLRGKPWRRTAMVLRMELSPYAYLLPPGEDLEGLISQLTYDDLEVLRAITLPPRLSQDHGKLKKYLLGKGFDYSVIKLYLEG